MIIVTDGLPYLAHTVCNMYLFKVKQRDAAKQLFSFHFNCCIYLCGIFPKKGFEFLNVIEVSLDVVAYTRLLCKRRLNKYALIRVFYNKLVSNC